MSIISVSIVEDERAARELLARLIRNTAGLTCLGVYSNAEAALEDVPVNPPDVLLMDLALPGRSGVECVGELRRRLPGLCAVMVTKYEDPESILAALKAGAKGYLLKRQLAGDLFQPISAAYRGEAPLSPAVAARLVTYFNEWGQKSPESTPLTNREKEVLNRLTEGLLYKEVAEALGISYQTVNGHVKHIYEKLQVRSRSEAIAIWLRR